MTSEVSTNFKCEQKETDPKKFLQRLEERKTLKSSNQLGRNKSFTNTSTAYNKDINNPKKDIFTQDYFDTLSKSKNDSECRPNTSNIMDFANQQNPYETEEKRLRQNTAFARKQLKCEKLCKCVHKTSQSIDTGKIKSYYDRKGFSRVKNEKTNTNTNTIETPKLFKRTVVSGNLTTSNLLTFKHQPTAFRLKTANHNLANSRDFKKVNGVKSANYQNKALCKNKTLVERDFVLHEENIASKHTRTKSGIENSLNTNSRAQSISLKKKGMTTLLYADNQFIKSKKNAESITNFRTTANTFWSNKRDQLKKFDSPEAQKNKTDEGLSDLGFLTLS